MGWVQKSYKKLCRKCNKSRSVRGKQVMLETSRGLFCSSECFIMHGGDVWNDTTGNKVPITTN
jgi:hypothetical protein